MLCDWFSVGGLLWLVVCVFVVLDLRVACDVVVVVNSVGIDCI